MAQRVQVILEDDLDRSPASETVSFGLDGVTYEIDLSDSNAARLRADMATWIGHGRRIGGRRGSSPKAAAGSRAAELAKMREWARNNGHEVSDRGRISGKIQEAYAKANA